MDLEAYLTDGSARDWDASDPDDGPVRLALVGLGWWVREMAIPAIAASDRCETAVLVSRNKADAEALAAEIDAAAAGISAEEYHDGAATDAYDAVYVCTPNATHLPYVETAAGLGKDILCEKPMEASADRAERLVETVAASESRLMVAYRMHTEPAVRRLRDLLGEGVLGDPVAVHGHMAQPLLEIIPDPDQWRLDPALAGPGASVTDIGVYPLNTARFVLGDDPVAVDAEMHSRGAAFADVPDERAAFTLAFPDGVHAACTASQAAARSSHLAVVGTAGHARLEPAFFPDQSRELSVTRGGTTVDVTFDRVDQMEAEFEYFADRLLSDRPFVADAEHGLVDVRVIEAVYNAAERGERIPV